MSSAQNQFVSEQEEEDKAYCSALNLRITEVFTHALSTSLNLGLFDIIGGAGSDVGLTALEITSHLHVKNPDLASKMIDRMLRLLASYDLLICSNHGVERQYTLSPTGKLFVRNEDGSCSVPLYLSNDTSWTEAWFKLKDAILEGENPYEIAHGVPMYKRIFSNPEKVKTFQKDMEDFSSNIMKKVLDRYNGFQGIKQLVDVGGGSGLALTIILSKYPHIDAINFDSPHVIKEAPSHPGVKHVGGDMFLQIPRAEAIMMKDVLHNWEDEQCIKILKNCYDSLPKGGKVIVVSHIMPEVIEATSTAAKYVCQMDVMMFLFPGGKQRTEKELKALSEAAGFSGFQLIYHFAYIAFGVIEFYK